LYFVSDLHLTRFVPVAPRVISDLNNHWLHARLAEPGICEHVAGSGIITLSPPCVHRSAGRTLTCINNGGAVEPPWELFCNDCGIVG
jgi:hypothetical protein